MLIATQYERLLIGFANDHFWQLLVPPLSTEALLLPVPRKGARGGGLVRVAASGLRHFVLGLSRRFSRLAMACAQCFYSITPGPRHVLSKSMERLSKIFEVRVCMFL